MSSPNKRQTDEAAASSLVHLGSMSSVNLRVSTSLPTRPVSASHPGPARALENRRSDPPEPPIRTTSLSNTLPHSTSPYLGWIKHRWRTLRGITDDLNTDVEVVELEPSAANRRITFSSERPSLQNLFEADEHKQQEAGPPQMRKITSSKAASLLRLPSAHRRNIGLVDMFKPPSEDENKVSDRASPVAAEDDLIPELPTAARKSSAALVHHLRAVGDNEHDLRSRDGLIDPGPSLHSYMSVHIPNHESACLRPGVTDLLVHQKPHLMDNPLSSGAADDDMGLTIQTSLNRKAVFGMWDGVVCRCLMQIFGGIMFLRLGYVFGQAGIRLGFGVILMCLSITLITTLSLSAIATNGIPHEGGTYYMISRSLGPKFGGAIGILLAISSTLEVSIYVIAFGEAVIGHIKLTNPDWSLTGSNWDIQVVAAIVIVIICALVLNGIRIVVKAQVAFLFVLSISVLSIYLGAFVQVPKQEVGFNGFSWELLKQNWEPDFSEGEDLSGMILLFFPAMTGFTAATTIYGRIRNPERALPYGTLLSLFVSVGVYLVTGFIVGASVVREVPNASNTGLKGRDLIMTDISVYSPLVFCGIYASTLSSAIASMVVAPRLLVAVAKDRLFPIMDPLTTWKPFSNDLAAPILVTVVIAFAGSMFGSINNVAPIFTGANVVSYLLINYAVFAASISGTPGWRPTFQYYNKWLSLLGCLLCLAGMFLVHAFASIGIIVAGVALYKYLDTTHSNVSWGSAGDAVTFAATISTLSKLNKIPKTIKTYRPNVLVLCGDPNERSGLVRLAGLLKKGNGLMMFGKVCLTAAACSSSCPASDQQQQHRVHQLLRLRRFEKSWIKMNEQLKHMKINGFVQVVMSGSLEEGCRSLAQISGISHLRANVVVLGFREYWQERVACSEEYVRMLQDLFALDKGVMVVRGYAQANFEDLLKPSPMAKQEFVDVWWLFDDGGLTLLLGYLLTKARPLRNATLRLMTVVSSVFGREAARMVGLLKQLRIKAKIVAIPVSLDACGEFQPSAAMLARFVNMCPRASRPRGSLTKRLLHVADLVHVHSVHSCAVLITIPMPGVCYQPPVYMAWLDCLSYDMPLTILVRGNQSNILSADL